MASNAGGFFTAAAQAGSGPIGSMVSGFMNRKEAKRNRQFQERMSNTAFQRSMADMRKAGLNPILAYQQGGGSTPGGSTGQQPDMGSSAVSGGRAATERTRLGQELRNLKQTERKDRSMELMYDQQWRMNSHSANNLQLETQFRELELEDNRLKFEFYKKNPTARGISRGMEMFGIKAPSFNFKSR